MSDPKVITIAGKVIYIRLREWAKNEWRNEFTIRDFKEVHK